MELIDTHTHLFVEKFDADRYKVIENAIASNINKMVLPGINSKYIALQKELAVRYPNICYPAVGLHPSDVKENYIEELKIVKENIKTGTFIAIGETGIDLYWDKTFKSQQFEAFEYQIELAKEFDLPIIIHVREAFEEVFKIIGKNNSNSLRGIFHSFTGTTEQAKQIIEFGGFKIGINGIVTFKNSGLDRTLSEIDMKHIVLETDSPYLSPAPKRGKRNESSHLIYIAQKLSDIYNLSISKISEITTKNAKEIFKF